ncbi:PDZ domain-containing protein [bacterium SCSIO 12741]|nr:PDZ domain-containing protein [bacterium SCSIO 12741]
MKRTILTLFVLTAFLQLSCQTSDLRRKTSLGVMLELVNDSLAAVHKTTPGKGLYIRSVVDGSTAEGMKIKAGDIITELNEAPINTIQDILSEVGKYRAGDQLVVKLYRGGKLKTVKGKAVARPQEQSEIADVHYGSVEYEGNRLRTMLHVPKGKEKPPVVFFIQGYPCQSVDLAFAQESPTRKMVDQWVKAGFAVYRIEKPGMGDSDSKKSCLELNFEEEIETFRNGYKDLESNPKIDPDNIFIFGHSIGGIIAPILGSEFKPKGIITYGTVINTWFEYMQELTRVQGVYFNSPDSVVEMDIRNATPFWYEMLVAQKSNEEILKNAEIRQMLEAEGSLKSFEQGQFIHRHYTYWSGIQNLNLTRYWSQVESQVLALYGEFDIQALHANHIYAIERTVNHSHPGKAKAEVIRGADHGFVRFESMEANVQTLNKGQYGIYSRQHYHEGVAQSTIQWMQSHLK